MDTTEQLHFYFSLSHIGEGNGNPLQCSCLENPRDGGAWWAAVYGVVQSRTQLKWLSSSSCWSVVSLSLKYVNHLSERKQLKNGYCNSLQKWVQGCLFFLPYASIFYIINVNYVAVRKAYIYFLRNFLKKCYPALKHSKQINYSGTEICIWSNVIEKEH